MSDSDTSSNAPQVLLGRYELHRLIARGGMAEVYLARDRSLDRPVAVKMLFPEFATDPAFVERFRREAQAVANLAHPNVVGVYDWGAEANTYFIVMEYVDGQSLAELVRSNGPLHPRRAAEIVFEVAGALGHAHSKGVVHRDVKPGNVLISSQGVAKVTDFGIARAMSSPSEDLTAAGSVMGTATYFSPEQAQGFPVDARSDLYSLGVVLFEMVTGQAPFSGDSPVAIAYKHVQEHPPRPSSLVSGLPVGLEAIIGRLLAKSPEHRYPSAQDLRADLRRWLDGDTPLALAALTGAADPDATTLTPAADPGATTVTPTMAATTVTPAVNATTVNPAVGPITGQVPVADPSTKRNGAFVGLLVALALVIAGLSFWLIQSLNDSGETATISVPGVVGKTEADARNAVLQAGLVATIREEASDSVDEGVVIRQTPAEGRKLASGKTVVLYVSTGPDAVAIPDDLAGLTPAAAKQRLTAAGFTNVVEQQQTDDTIAEGKVIGTDPAGGEKVSPTETINLLISSGSEGVTIPTVANMTQSDARKALVAAGFEVGTSIQQADATVTAGRVIGTSPTGTASKGSTVQLIVSTGPDQISVPSVKGQTEDDATAVLRAKGLDVEIVPKSVSASDANAGRVISQTPAAGEEVDAGTTVQLTVGVASATTTTTATTSSVTSTSSTTSTTTP